MKIGIVTKGLAPYRLDFYEQLAASDDFEVCVLVPSLTSSDHPWEKQLKGRVVSVLIFEGKGYGGRWGKLLKFFGFGGYQSAGWSPSLWMHLSESAYEALLVHEASPYCWTAIIWGAWHRVPVYMSSDVGRGSPPHACGVGTRIVHGIASLFIRGRIANTPAAESGYGIRRSCIFAPHASLPRVQDRQLSIREKVVILFVGHLCKDKGVDLLLSSLPLIKAGSSFVLRLVGDQKGDWDFSSELRKVPNPSSVEVVGFREGADLWNEYQAADVFVLPTRYDTYGVVIQEAAHFGLPLVVSQAAGAASVLVKQGENGFTFVPGNVVELARLLTVLVDSPEMRGQMAIKSRKVADEFGVLENVKKVSQYFLRSE